MSAEVKIGLSSCGEYSLSLRYPPSVLNQRVTVDIKAICNLSGISIRAQVAQIIQSHLIRFKPHYKKKIAYTARKYGLTFEEAFALLQTKSPPFGDVVEIAPVKEDEEVSNIGSEAKNLEEEERGTNTDE